MPAASGARSVSLTILDDVAERTPCPTLHDQKGQPRPFGVDALPVLEGLIHQQHVSDVAAVMTTLIVTIIIGMTITMAPRRR